MKTVKHIYPKTRAFGDFETCLRCGVKVFRYRGGTLETPKRSCMTPGQLAAEIERLRKIIDERVQFVEYKAR